MAFHAADAPRLVVLRAAVITAIARRRTVIGWTAGREPGPHASFPAIASRVAVGFDADILAIDGNPLEELAAIRRLRAVYAHGLPVSPAPDVPASVAVH